MASNGLPLLDVKLISDELARAHELGKSSFYTEACVRLGRAMEASLYATAMAAGVSVEDRELKELERVRQLLLETQSQILRTKDVCCVEQKLPSAAKHLATAVYALSKGGNVLEGQVRVEPRRTVQLLKDIAAGIDNTLLSSRIRSLETTVTSIQIQRNKCAHAASSGDPYEADKDEFELMLSEVNEFLEALSDAYLGASSASS